MEKITVENLLEALEKAQLKLDVNLRDLNSEERLVDQGIDSLDMASILFEIEDAFACEIDGEEIVAGKWNSLTNICNSINAQRER